MAGVRGRRDPHQWPAMSFLRALPPPPGWRGQHLKLTLSLLAGLGVVALFSYWGVAAMVHGSYLTTVVTTGWVTFLVLTCGAVVLVSLGRTTVHTTSAATGFTVWPDRRFSALVLAGIIAFIPAGALFAVLASFGQLDLPLAHSRPGMWAGLMGFAVFLAVTGLITARRRRGVGHVTLTQTWIENADIVSTRITTWNDIVDVADRAKSTRAPRAVVLRLREGGEEVIGSANVYLPGGAALYWLVRHYWKHPEDREELADDRASERLLHGRFDLS